MVAAIGTAYAGLTALCAGMERHQRQLRPGAAKLSARVRLILRAGGWLCLALSLWISIRACGTGIGWVAWFGILSATTALLVLQLAYAPRRIWLLANGVGIVSLLLVVAG